MEIELNEHYQIKLPEELTTKMKELEDMLEPMLDKLSFYEAFWAIDYIKECILIGYQFKRMMPDNSKKELSH